MRSLRIFGLVAPLALTSAACTAILGGFDFEGKAAGGGGGTGGGGTSCEPLSQKNCYDADPSTLEGECHAGKQTCKADGSGYDDCKGQVLPAMADDCEAMKDATCDGKLSCTCSPKSTVDCYEGPDGTDAHPPCKGGKRTCADDGSGYGTCDGQVKPEAVDDCATPSVDENCDGVPNDLCTCEPGETQSCYDGPSGTEGVGICQSGTQECNDTGTGWEACTGQVEPAVEQCDVAGDEDCDGVRCSEVVWADMFPIQYAEVTGALSLTVDAQGNSLVGFAYEGWVDFGNGLPIPNVQGASVLAKIGPDGKALWRVDGVRGPVAIDQQGNVYVTQADGASGVNVSAYSSTGVLKWSKSWSVPGGFGAATGIAHDGIYYLTVVGSYGGGALAFGSGPLTLPVASGAADGFVVKLAQTTGAPVWAQRVTDAAGQTGAAQYLAGVAVDAGGQVFVTGKFTTSVAIGAQSLVNMGTNDFFVAKLDQAAGAPVWLKAFGSAGGDTVSGIAIDATGNPLIVGSSGSSADFGGGLLVNHGKSDAFLLHLDTTGAHKWSRLVGGAENDSGLSVAFDASNRIVFAGTTYSSSLDLGGPTLTNAGAFLAKYDSFGNHIWSKSFGDGWQTDAWAATPRGANDIFLAIVNSGSVNVGTGLLSSGTDSVILARFQP